MLITSPKQDQSFAESNHRFNIWVGSIRAGKTFASIRRIIHEIKHGPPGDVMFLGVNRQSIDRNILEPLYKMIGFPVPNPKTMKTHLYGRSVYFVGCPDISAVSTIKGATLAIGYVDEITEIPEAVFKMFEGRLSVPGAKLIGTTNPDGPSHWFKKQYIDNAENIDLIYWNFTLDDNPILDEEYKKRIKASYTGLWYNRYILGQWAMASGAIFDTFDNDNIYSNPFPTPSYYLVGIDYGTTNATAAVLVGVSPKKWPQFRIEEEYYYDSAKIGRAKTDEELSKDILDFVKYKNVTAIYVDPAAASFKIALRQKDLPVIDANNDVLLGIKTMSKFISGKNFVVQRGCKTVIEQIQSYAWCPKAAANGEDKPIKKTDHIIDACRYACTPFMNSGDFGCADESLNIENLRRKVYGDEGYGYMNPNFGQGYF